MNILPGQVRALHFIGIGGIGMSGIAEVLHKSGFQVQGADISESYNTKRLESLGIPVFIGHDAKNLAKVQAVVISTAVKPDNVEGYWWKWSEPNKEWIQVAIPSA